MTTQTYGPYSPIRTIRTSGWMHFISGQVGIDPTNKQAPAGVHDQTRLALENLRNILISHNLEFKDVIKTTVFLKSMDDFAVVNDIYQEYFPAPRPARSCVAVAALPRIGDNELLVEIEAIAFQEAET